MRANTRRQNDHDDVGPIYPGRLSSVLFDSSQLFVGTYRTARLVFLQMMDLYQPEDFERTWTYACRVQSLGSRSKPCALDEEFLQGGRHEALEL